MTVELLDLNEGVLKADQETFDRIDAMVDTNPIMLRDLAWELVCKLVAVREKLAEEESALAQTVDTFGDWIDDHRDEVTDLGKELAEERARLQRLAHAIILCEGMTGVGRLRAEEAILAKARKLLDGTP